MGGKRGSLPGEIGWGSTEKMRSADFRIKKKDLSKKKKKKEEENLRINRLVKKR